MHISNHFILCPAKIYLYPIPAAGAAATAVGSTAAASSATTQLTFTNPHCTRRSTIFIVFPKEFLFGPSSVYKFSNAPQPFPPAEMQVA